MVAVLTITPWIYDLVLSSSECHSIFMSSVTLLLQFKEEPLQTFPRKISPFSSMLQANISSTFTLYIKLICKNLKQGRAKAAPWIILLVASLHIDTSPFIKSLCCLFFTYFLPTLKFCYLGPDFVQPVQVELKSRAFGLGLEQHVALP